MMGYYIWFYTIILVAFVLGSVFGNGQLFNDKELFKYENEQLEREAFRRVNSWTTKHVPFTTMEESVVQMKGLIRKSKNSNWRHKLSLARILMSPQPFDSVAKYVIQAIKQLKATTLIDDSNICSDESSRLLLRIFKGLFKQDGVAMEEENHLQRLVAPVFWLHANHCYDLYLQRYAEIMSELPSEVKDSVDNFLDNIVNLRFVARQVDKNEVAVMLLDSLRAALPSAESMFVGPGSVEHDKIYKKNLARLKELLERHLRCREYYQALGPRVFELILMDRVFNGEHTQVSESAPVEFYQSWSKVRICKWIVESPDKVASNMMLWAVS